MGRDKGRDKDALAKTAYHEARGEGEDGWRSVAHVVKNRAKRNKEYWGGDSVHDVCMQPGQFECWDKGRSTAIEDKTLYNKIKNVTDRVYDGYDSDPTDGSDHYNNPTKEGYPEWTKNCNRTKKIGNHQFYKDKNQN